MHFAPTAHVALTQFDEKDRPIMIAVPMHGRNFLLARIDSNERAGTDERVQGVVVHSDVSVQRIGAIHLLKHERDFIPSFQYLGHEVSPLHTQFLS